MDLVVSWAGATSGKSCDETCRDWSRSGDLVKAERTIIEAALCNSHAPHGAPSQSFVLRVVDRQRMTSYNFV